MSVLYLGKEKSLKEFENVLSTSDFSNNLLFKKTSRRGHFTKSGGRITFNSSIPIFKEGTYLTLDNIQSSSFDEIINGGQNNFCTIDCNVVKNTIHLAVSSARIGRDRVYFLKKKNGVFFSDDIRELVSFSGKVFNREAFYSILKFGDTPEYITCVQGIYSVPVGSYWKGYLELFLEKIDISDFTPYYRMSYDFKG